MYQRLDNEILEAGQVITLNRCGYKNMGCGILKEYLGIYDGHEGWSIIWSHTNRENVFSFIKPLPIEPIKSKLGEH